MTIIRYSQLVMPQDANVLGTLFGGQMVSWMDIAASKAVHRFLKDSVAEAALTRAIDAIEFKEAVHVGDWVNFESKIIKTGRSSIIIQVDAFKEHRNDKQVLACNARFTFVSVIKLADGSYQKANHNKSL
jgi:acyl-CoA thioesterase YciA|tara:strand:- start:8753 stop:9142 length:390 start_codon:yes stop_codon:yes gene_type:complete